MKSHHARRAATLGGIALAGSMILAPAAAMAQPLATEEAAADACTVTGGTLDWGVKESFRAYISGNIAHGSWDTSDGADYETPNFRWSGATGEIDPETGDGTVSFAGAVHFTGHDGVLDLVLANPRIEFEDGEAALLIDSKSNDMEGNLAVDAKQQWVGDVTVKDPIAPKGDQLELADLPAKLTNEGAKAFAGFYEAGAELDPLSLSLEFEGCASTANADDAEAETQDPEPAEDPQLIAGPDQEIPWLPIGIGGAALFVIGLTVGLLIGGRTPKSRDRGAARAEAGASQGAGSSDEPFGEEK